MGEEFYAIIKLVSGEEIMSLISVDEEYEDPIVILQKPIIMKVHQHGHGNFIKVKPWMELSSDEMFLIKPDRIITMTEIRDPKVIAIYERYCLEDTDDTLEFNRIQGKVQVSNQMGYVSSVEEARELFESLYNESKPDKES